MPSFQENKSAQGQGRGEVTYRSETNPPAGKWFLLEWEYNDDPSSISLWVDGDGDPVNGEGGHGEVRVAQRQRHGVEPDWRV